MKKISGAFVLISLANICMIFLGGCTERTLNVSKFDRDRILSAAEIYLDEEAVTVTSAQFERSTGGIHDFYSEGDYWWPDPENPRVPIFGKTGIPIRENSRPTEKPYET